MQDMTYYNAARTALQVAVRIDDVREIRNRAAAAKAYAEQAQDRAMIDWATEIKARAERRAGEILAEMRAKGERATPETANPGGGLVTAGYQGTPTLSDLGISRMQASRWQKVAAIPEPEFEQALAARKQEASADAAILRTAKLQKKATKKKKKAQERAAIEPLIDPADYDLRVCSCADLLTSGIHCDAVITDPPYPKEHLGVFTELAAACRTAEIPLVAVMVGQTYLPEVMARLCAHLPYRWTLAYLMPGGQAVQQFPRKVNTFWKPVLLFGESEQWFGDVCRSDVNDNDKRFHNWGQSESGMVDLIERLTLPGQTICDPFLGGGTTAVCALSRGRKFIGCDIDSDCITKTRTRLLA